MKKTKSFVFKNNGSNFYIDGKFFIIQEIKKPRKKINSYIISKNFYKEVRNSEDLFFAWSELYDEIKKINNLSELNYAKLILQYLDWWRIMATGLFYPYKPFKVTWT